MVYSRCMFVCITLATVALATPPDGRYTLTNINSGKVLNVAQNAMNDGANVWQWDDPENTASQWQLASMGDGVCILTNVNSGKALNVENNGMNDGSNVWQWDNPENPSSQWRLTAVADNTYKIMNAHSGKLLNVQDNSMNNGANVWQWTDLGKSSSVWRFTAVATPAPSPPPTPVQPPLSTLGNQIVDSNGMVVRFACLNWYGAHMERFVVNGLDQQPIGDIAAHIASMGFNCIRLVFSNDLYFKNPSVAASAVSKNPELAGLPAMEVFDKTVEALTGNGLMIILNNHISHAGWCCSESDGNGLWYTDEYPTDKWQSMWVGFVERYKSNPLVIAVDLRNELRAAHGVSPTWGTGDAATDWKKAAQDCGDVVLSHNKDLLVIVEGLSYANILLHTAPAVRTNTTLSACDHCYVQNYPVQLAVPNKLVYSGHVYSWDKQFAKTGYDAFEEAVEQYETYVATSGQPYTAPFWLGEFGTSTDDYFWKNTITLLQKHPNLGWALWALDGYQHPGKDESFGIFEQDYKTIRHPWKLKDLQTVQGKSNGLLLVV